MRLIGLQRFRESLEENLRVPFVIVLASNINNR